MATITQVRESSTRRSSKPRRDVSQSNLPLKDDGKLDLVQVLVAALTVPGRLSQCYNRFHRYSFLNMLLVYMQTGRLEPMGTFNKWKSLNRKVTKGSKALFVNHPKFAPERDENGQVVVNANGKPEMKVIGFHPKATVFQLFQTEGPDLKMPDVPDWDREQAMNVLDVHEVPFKDGDGNTQGYSIDNRFAINPVAESPFKTMIHEWAHILLGHTEGGYAEHPRDIAEFQAEAVALLVCTELDVEGFDSSNSHAYIQGWLKGKNSDYLDDNGDLLVTDSVVREIFSVVDKILVAGRKAHYDKMADQG